jgi:hypothetical protein
MKPFVLAVLLLALPQPILDALEARFPGAEIRKWSKEKEHGAVLYDVEFTHAGLKLEADMTPDGKIDNWEKEIAAADLPAVVRDAALAKHPGARIVEVMEMTNVVEGKDALGGYEIVLEPKGGKKTEIAVAPDGKILEEDGDDD